MNNLFAFLIIITLIVLIVGLIKPSVVKQTSRKRVGLIFASAAVIFFILFSITTPKTTMPVSVQSDTPVTSQTLDQKIAVYAAQIYGNGISYVGTSTDNIGLSVTLSISNIVGPATFRNKTGLLASKIFQDVFAANPSTQEINVLFTGQKTDAYGNTSTGTLMGYYMTKATFAKFNWSNFDGMTLCDVLRQANNTENVDTPNSQYTDGCTIFATDLR